MMRLAFFSLAGATTALCVAVSTHLHTAAGKVGLALLALAAFGVVLGGVFLTDPITTDAKDWSTSATLHNIGGSLMILLSPFAAALLTWSLGRHNPTWRPVVVSVAVPVVLMWICTIVFFAVVSAKSGTGKAGPDVPMGWPNRAFMVSYCLWLLAMARGCLRVAPRSTSA